jgi:hypothetical protein
LLALPEIRFMFEHPGEYSARLTLYSAVWTRSQPFLNRLGEFLANYWTGLSPVFWFLPSAQRFPDYRVADYAYLPIVLLPFFLWGGWLMLKRWKEPWARAMIFWLIVTPVSAASVGVQLVRVLVFVFPAMVWTMVGLEDVLQRVQKKWNRPWESLALSSGLLMGAAALGMVVNVFILLPVWEWDPVDYGARYQMERIFAEAVQYRQEHPDWAVSVTPNMIWNTPILQTFYAGDDPMMDTQAIDIVLRDYVPEWTEKRVFVVSVYEYQDLVLPNNKVEVVQVERVVRNRWQEPMAFFIKVRYRANAQEIFAEERVARHALREGQIELDGMWVRAAYSLALEDSLALAFDGDPLTAFQTDGVNPLVVHLDFDSPQMLKGVQLRLGAEPLIVTVRIQTVAGAELDWQLETQRKNDFREVMVDFGDTQAVQALQIEVLNPNGLHDEIVHLWEVVFSRP